MERTRGIHIVDSPSTQKGAMQGWVNGDPNFRRRKYYEMQLNRLAETLKKVGALPEHSRIEDPAVLANIIDALVATVEYIYAPREPRGAA